MKVEQISVFLENKSGRLAEVTRVLGGAGVNIRALSIADTSDFGILRIIVNDTARAVQALKDKDFTVSKTEVLAVEVPDSPGGLAKIMGLLDSRGINVEYMYAVVERRSDNAIVIFRFDENDRAVKALTDAGIPILDASKVYSL